MPWPSSSADFPWLLSCFLWTVLNINLLFILSSLNLDHYSRNYLANHLSFFFFLILASEYRHSTWFLLWLSALWNFCGSPKEATRDSCVQTFVYCSMLNMIRVTQTCPRRLWELLKRVHYQGTINLLNPRHLPRSKAHGTVLCILNLYPHIHSCDNHHISMQNSQKVKTQVSQPIENLGPPKLLLTIATCSSSTPYHKLPHQNPNPIDPNPTPFTWVPSASIIRMRTPVSRTRMLDRRSLR